MCEVRRAGQRLLLVGVAWLLAGAAAPDDAREPPRGLVVGVMRGADRDEAAEVLESIRARFDTASLDLVAIDASAAPVASRERLRWSRAIVRQHDALGGCWVDLSDDEHVFVFVVDAQAKQMLLRRLPRAESRFVTAERVGLVVADIALGLREGRTLGLDPVVVELAPPPEVAPPNDDDARPPAWPRLRLAAGYEGAMLAPERPWRNGALIEGSLWVRPVARVGLRYGVSRSGPIDDGSLRVDITTHRPVGTAGVRWRVHPRVAVELDLALGAEVVHRLASSRAPDVEALPSSTWVSALGSARAVLALRFVQHLRLLCGLGVEAVVPSSLVEVEVAGQRRPLLSPWPVRAVMSVSAAYDVWPR